MSDLTPEAVAQWLAKARNDWAAVEILLASGRAPAETVCFHAQQHVEKLLKAVLTCHAIETPKTHDQRRLIQLAESSVPELAELADASDSLTVHGVQTRYPGDELPAGPGEVAMAVDLARQFGALLIPKVEH